MSMSKRFKYKGREQTPEDLARHHLNLSCTWEMAKRKRFQYLEEREKKVADDQVKMAELCAILTDELSNSHCWSEVQKLIASWYPTKSPAYAKIQVSNLLRSYVTSLVIFYQNTKERL